MTDHPLPEKLRQLLASQLAEDAGCVFGERRDEGAVGGGLVVDDTVREPGCRAGPPLSRIRVFLDPAGGKVDR